MGVLGGRGWRGSAVHFHKRCWLSHLHQKHWSAKSPGIEFPCFALLPIPNLMFITIQSALEKEKEGTTKSTELRSLTAWCDEGQLK